MNNYKYLRRNGRIVCKTMELAKGQMFRAVILLFLFLIPGHYGATIRAKPLETLNTFKMRRLALSFLNEVEKPETTDGSLTKSINFDVNRLVPSGPNPEKSPDAPPKRENVEGRDPFGTNPGDSLATSMLEVKRLVPSGPNPQQSPEAPPKPEHLKVSVYSQSNSFEESPPRF